ncbi:MAG: hypothetical protein WC152_00685 [Candidatus Izemoplasmatales bacterium]
MATYKKGFKKQNAETLLLKTIVAIIAAVILVVLVAFIYGSMTKWKDYNNYNSIDKYADAFDMKDANDQAISDYVIYVYSDNCEGCDNIRNDVLRLANKLGENEFFLMNISNVEDESEDFLETIDKTSVQTPMLIIVNDGEFEELFSGSVSVVDVLKTIEDNTYAPFLD